ncbi:D-alanyl-D-alanine carboxypeptidase [Deinococcus psychrotolerans]|uniref:D-alanyl-D-alanine carboxypeptidase n=1 Tax=Deinococcus psychrotolerans TaxID=2489213 RepID=A0A3G8YFI7_9DEIO|nr:D-alanyl-D-alanine carboxypeptidase [Deinococcus psychrotolerans]AZI42947.1 D-alanyl-D-alanine carboxypeptidase [Deinococcus psychrotolerans]
MRSLLTVPLLIAPLLAASLAGAAEVTLRPVLSPAVSALLQRPPSPAHTGLLVRDLTTGKVVEASRPDELFTPASTLKIVSMAARLSQSGPQAWYSADVTASAAEVNGKASALSSVTLRGGGDPSFSIQGRYSLAALAKQLSAKGIKSVGEVRLAPTVDSSTWPALPLGTPVVAVRLSEYPGWNDTAERYAERVISAFEGQLRAAGIQVGGGQSSSLGHVVGQAAVQQFGSVIPGASPPLPAPPPELGLATVRSQPLIELAKQTLKPSDNVWAEQIAAELGSKVAGNGAVTHAGMVAGLRAFLTKVGVNAAPMSLNDASGLSGGNRLTPRSLVTVLSRMYDLPITASKTPITPLDAFTQRKNLFIEALPRGATGEASAEARALGGTLAGRFVGSGLDVRAKTGTLPGVSSLAGYVRGKSGHVLAFALMMDQAPGNTLDLRAYQDRMVKVIAQNH